MVCAYTLTYGTHIILSVSLSYMHTHLPTFPSHQRHISLHFPVQWLRCIRTVPEPMQPYSVPRPRL